MDHCECIHHATRIKELERQVQEAHAELGLASQTDVQARLHARVSEFERENQIIASQRDEYRDAVSTLEDQGVTGMVEDWICVPAVVWWQVFEKLNTGRGNVIPTKA